MKFYPQIYMRFPGGKDRAVTFSYDDGVEQDARLIDILNENGLKATFNLSGKLFADEGQVWPEGQIHRRLTLSAAQKLYIGSGHEIGFHGCMHGFMDSMPANRQAYEIIADRALLEQQFGGMVRGGAYPFGTHSNELVEALRASGVTYFRTVHSTHNFEVPQDWLRLNPTCHHDDEKYPELVDKFLTTKVWARPLFFYVWGHAYEFEQFDNWERFEEQAKKLANQENVYYATNIELYDYIKAFEGLRISCDGGLIENPWAIPVWFWAEGKTYQINPGERIQL